MKEFEDLNAYEKRLLHTQLSCGKSLVELSSFNEITLLWFVDFEFHKFLIDTYNTKNNGIHSKVGKNNFRILAIFCYRLMEFLVDYLIKYFSIIIVKFFKGTLTDHQKTSPNKVILFTGQDIEWRPIFDIHTRHIKIGDQFFSSLIQTINQKNKNNYYLLSTNRLNFPYYKSIFTLIDKLKNWTVPHVPFEIYYNNKIFNQKRIAVKHFKKIWNSIDSDPIFNEILKSTKPEISEKIRCELKKYYTVSFPSSVKYIFTAYTLIEKINPSIVIFECEYCGFQRALLNAARLQAVPTLAIQHGIIDPSVSVYFHDKMKDTKLKFLEYPIPDITVVYGFYEYNLLINNSNYSKENVVITGSHRYDSFINFDTIYSKKEFLKRYDINISDKIILWTTQSHALSDEENLMNYDAVFDAVRQIDNATLIIKPHPGESSAHLKMIEFFKNKYPIHCIVEKGTANTFELLSVCDLLITKHSMTGLEAIALNKPVIVLNLGEFPDIGDYVKEGVASGIYNKHNLKPTIEQLLLDDSDLERKRASYIKNHLYAIDGKSTERIVNVIEDLISKKG